MAAWVFNRPDNGRGWRTDRPGEVADRDSTVRVLRERLPATVATLEEVAGVVLLGCCPFKPDEFSSTQALDAKARRESCDANLPVARFREQRALVDDVVSPANRPRTILLDPSARPGGDVCVPFLQGTRVYSENVHINSAASMRYRDDIVRVLDEVMRRSRRPATE